MPLRSHSNCLMSHKIILEKANAQLFRRSVYLSSLATEPAQPYRPFLVLFYCNENKETPHTYSKANFTVLVNIGTSFWYLLHSWYISHRCYSLPVRIRAPIHLKDSTVAPSPSKISLHPRSATSQQRYLDFHIASLWKICIRHDAFPISLHVLKNLPLVSNNQQYLFFPYSNQIRGMFLNPAPFIGRWRSCFGNPFFYQTEPFPSRCMHHLNRFLAYQTPGAEMYSVCTLDVNMKSL